MGSVRGRPGQRSRGADGVQLSAGHGIPARKERHFMTQIDKLIDQPCDDPFSASVKLRGYTFRQRSYLAILIGFSLARRPVITSWRLH